MPSLLQHARTEKQYSFKSREELIALFASGAGAGQGEARTASFGLLPKADVVIERYPKFREKNGPNEYNPPAEDGSRPGGVLHQRVPGRKNKAAVEDESTAFHETIPGHHLQGAIALERKENSSDRPLSRKQRTIWKAGRCTPSGLPTR